MLVLSLALFLMTVALFYVGDQLHKTHRSVTVNRDLIARVAAASDRVSAMAPVVTALVERVNRILSRVDGLIPTQPAAVSAASAAPSAGAGLIASVAQESLDNVIKQLLRSRAPTIGVPGTNAAPG